MATYVAMAVGAPLGVTLNHYFGISGFATVVVLVAAIGLLFARTRRDVKVTAGTRAPFHAVVRKSGLTAGAGLWHRRFRRYRHLYHPLLRRAQLAGRRVYPFAVQRRLYLRSPGAGKYHYPLWRSPGLPACFIIESLGLLLIWLAPSAWMAGVGAFLTGSGFSLVFPALGVEAVKQVEEQNQGTALGTYSAFLDLALGLTGPLAGWVAGFYDLATLYLLAAIVVALAFLLIFRVHRQQRLVARE